MKLIEFKERLEKQGVSLSTFFARMEENDKDRFEIWDNNRRRGYSFERLISSAFSWYSTEEGTVFWRKVAKEYNRSSFTINIEGIKKTDVNPSYEIEALDPMEAERKAIEKFESDFPDYIIANVEVEE